MTTTLILSSLVYGVSHEIQNMLHTHSPVGALKSSSLFHSLCFSATVFLKQSGVSLVFLHGPRLHLLGIFG